MATATHVSHFDLEQIGETDDNVLFEGTLAACKRMAFAHGCEVASEEGSIVAMDGPNVIVAPGPIVRVWLKGQDGGHAGMIAKTRDQAWVLVLNREAWEKN